MRATPRAFTTTAQGRPRQKGRALLIVNPGSRQGDAELEQTLAALFRKGIEVAAHYRPHPREIGTIIRRHRADVDRVILGGGDGTLNAAAAALYETQIPFGILPLGTANDLARTLGLPIDPQAASEVIAAGRTRRIDLGQVNDIYFFNVASIGLSAQLTEQLTAEEKKRWGILAYVRALGRVLHENHSFRATIIFDGHRVQERAIQIAVGNGRYYGAGMIIAEEADITSHRLVLYSLRPQSLWELVRLAPSLRKGQQRGRPKVRVLDAGEIEIRTTAPLPVDADGELRTTTPARFRVIPEAVPVFVPPEGPDVTR